MSKTPPGNGGVSVHGSERVTPTKPRPILQASAAARMRLAALLWPRFNDLAPSVEMAGFPGAGENP